MSKTRAIQVGSTEVQVESNKAAVPTITDLADKAGYNTFWVFMEKAGRRREIPESELKGKTVADLDKDAKIVVERFDEGGK